MLTTSGVGSALAALVLSGSTQVMHRKDSVELSFPPAEGHFVTPGRYLPVGYQVGGHHL